MGVVPGVGGKGGWGGEINRNRMAWVRRERSSEAEKNIKRRERVDTTTMMEKLLIVVQFVWKVGVERSGLKTDIMPPLTYSCHEFHESRATSINREAVRRGWRPPVF